MISVYRTGTEPEAMPAEKIDVDAVISSFSEIRHNNRYRGQGQKGIHGMNMTPEYCAWVSMRRRCQAKRSPKQSSYIARGITVCERWSEFINFYEDMGPRPSDKHSLDRIDNNGNYEPGNCRWATAKEQNRNRRGLLWITYNGRTQLLADWSRELGIEPSVLSSRIKKGLPEEQIFTPYSLHIFSSEEERKCKNCDKPIPRDRKNGAKYCCTNCVKRYYKKTHKRK